MNTSLINNRKAYRNKIKRRQTIIFGTLGISLAILLFVNTLFWLNLVAFPYQPGFSKPVPKEVVYACSPTDKPVDPTEISARVYNASGEAGLAAKVTQSLTDAGVITGEAANWVDTEEVTDAVRLITNKENLAKAYSLRGFFPDAKVVLDSTNKTQVVDVVIGTAWKAMTITPTAEEFTAGMQSTADCVKP